MSQIEERMKVRVFEAGQEIDEAIVLRVGKGGFMPSINDIEIESTKNNRGQKTEFVFISDRNPYKEGWKILFEEPMTGGRCYSENAPTYSFESVS